VTRPYAEVPHRRLRVAGIEPNRRGDFTTPRGAEKAAVALGAQGGDGFPERCPVGGGQATAGRERASARQLTRALRDGVFQLRLAAEDIPHSELDQVALPHCWRRLYARSVVYFISKRCWEEKIPCTGRAALWLRVWLCLYRPPGWHLWLLALSARPSGPAVEAARSVVAKRMRSGPPARHFLTDPARASAG